MVSTSSPRSAPSTPPPAKRRRTLSPPRTMDPLPTISLTEDEERVRKLLVDAAEEIDRSLPPSIFPATVQPDEPLTLRFTGGWVRDKLLGGQCNDIDVGINKMTGFHFANQLTEFLERNMDRYEIPSHNIHKIESNPEKSKHLETATTKLLDLDIDFVNLRCETYTGNSRIPEMEFGTPEQDALRRDACVNALFYNIHTKEVEDWTKRGLKDMKDGLIRTPLKPFVTFQDDPLRVLRLIRFASRLGFTIVDESKEAMKHPEIQEALRLKISRERVGIEVEKMLKGPNPFLGLTLIYDLSLYKSIFAPPTEVLPADIPIPASIPAMSQSTTALQHILTAPEASYINLRDVLIPSSHERLVAWNLAALTPWKDYMFPGADKKKEIPGAATAAREGLRSDNKLHATIVSSYRHYQQIQDFVSDAATSKLSRGRIGMFVRSLGQDWRSQYLLSLLLELNTTWPQKESPSSSTPLPSALPTPNPASTATLNKFSTVLQHIVDLDLLEAPSIKPILNGKEMLVLLEQRRPGPWMTNALARVVEWQLDHSEEGKEAAEEWVKSMKEELVRV